MKKAVLIALFCMIFSGLAFADCAVYIDSKAFMNDTYSFCWLSGNICYNCYNINTGDSCASDWRQCDPNPRKPPPPPPILEASVPAAPACQRPPVLRHDRMSRLNARELL